MNDPDIMLDKMIQKAQNFEQSETVVSQDTLAKGNFTFLVKSHGRLTE